MFDDARARRFNRTSVELKRSVKRLKRPQFGLSFNRTSVELKPDILVSAKRGIILRFNRTSVELKHANTPLWKTSK